MDRVEIKQWAKEKIKGHIWEILLAAVITGFLTNLTFGGSVQVDANGNVTTKGVSIPVGILLYFVEVGFTAYMLNFIHDKKDLFKYSNEFARMFVAGLIQRIMLALFTLLLIVPGIIKAYAYALLPYLLADEKYNDLSYMDLLKKSEEIMKGHKLDLFVFHLSYIGWHILAIFTLGLLEIWIIPYFKTAEVKMLSEIKEAYEK